MARQGRVLGETAINQARLVELGLQRYNPHCFHHRHVRTRNPDGWLEQRKRALLGVTDLVKVVLVALDHVALEVAKACKAAQLSSS